MNNIKELITRLNDELINWSEAYYVNQKPPVSDSVYDAQIKKLESLVSEYPEYQKLATALTQVGSKIDARFKKVEHKVKMLSLSNTFNFDDVKDFDKRIKTQLGRTRDIEYVTELKIDGLSISLIYKDGKLLQGITRGNGDVGEDVTHNVLVIDDIPKRIPYKKELIVRGEIYMPISVFKKINSESKEKMANPRNAASGSLRQLDSKVTKTRRLKSFIYSLVQPDAHGVSSHEQSLNFMKELGFASGLRRVSKNVQGVIDSIEEFSNIRSSLDYETDGIVIKVNDINLYEDIGYTVKFPKFMTAYKFPEEIATTELLNIFPTVGRTGRITYNAKLKPVRLAGTTVSAATLHNADYIREININIGDFVKVKKAGEIIPKVLGVEKKVNKEDWKEETYCPGCHTVLVRKPEEVDQYCINDSCPLRNIAAMEHFVSRVAMDIEGVSSEILRKFISEGLISDLPSILDLPNKQEEMLSLPGFKSKSVDNIVKSVEKSKTQDLDRFIFALGIRHVGAKYSKIVAKRFGTLENIMQATHEDFIKIRELGPKVSSSIESYFNSENNINMINDFIDKGLSLSKLEETSSSIFEGLTFVITGTLSKPRKLFADIIEKNNGNVSGSISSKTNYLLYGEKAGSKFDKAKKLNVKTINEEEFNKLIGENNV